MVVELVSIALVEHFGIAFAFLSHVDYNIRSVYYHLYCRLGFDCRLKEQLFSFSHLLFDTLTEFLQHNFFVFLIFDVDSNIDISLTVFKSLNCKSAAFFAAAGLAGLEFFCVRNENVLFVNILYLAFERY